MEVEHTIGAESIHEVGKKTIEKYYNRKQIDMIGAAHPSYKPDNFIIGVSGYARAGKDTIGDILVKNHGFTKFAFADKLRETLYTLDPVVGMYYYDKNPDLVTFQDVIDKHGWGGYKETEWGNEMRRLLQRMGTEVGRDMIADDIWVRELDKAKGRVVVTDMRFPNEFMRVKQNGGIAWRVERPNTKPANPHVSEIALDTFDFDDTLYNRESISDLETDVGGLMDKYGITGTVL